MVRRTRRVLLAFGLILVSIVVSTSVGDAQATGVTPVSAPAGTEITIFGDGFEPGEEITICFGGTELVVFADDEGSFTTGYTIDPLMPPGLHPMSITGDQGNFFEFEYQVDEPPPPTTATTQAPTTTAAPTTTEGATATTDAATTTTEFPPTTTTATTVVPTTVPTTTVDEDSRVSTSDGGGVPWWLFLLAILFALALGAGVMMAVNNNTAKSGTFSDTSGNNWEYCSGRCRVKYKTVTDTNGRRVLVSAVPRRGNPCTGSGCGCVLFQNPAGGGAPILLDEDGGSVTRVGGVEYSARCVKKV